MSWPVGAEQLAIVAGAVLLGCVLQRTSGMGTGLIVSPTLVLAIGPVSGVVLTNIITVTSATLMTIALRAHVDRARLLRIAPVVVVGSAPAALLVLSAEPGWLEVIIGSVLLFALGGAGLLRRVPEVPSTPAALGVGVVGGFLNTAVGVAAPAMLIYAGMTRWPHQSFAATLQPIFLTMGAVSLMTKTVMGATGPGGLPPWPMIALAVGMVPLGVVLGGWVARRSSAVTARRVAVLVVSVGAAGTLLRGLLQLLVPAAG